MADKNFLLSIVLGVVDKASAEMQKFDKTLKDNKETIATIGIQAGLMGAAITGAIGYAIKDAAEFETAYRQLQSAVEATGGSFEDSKPAIDGFVESIKNMTTLTDNEAVVALKNMLIYTKDTTSAMEGVQIAANIASSGLAGMDQATRLVGMAMNGNVQMLGRLLPEFRGLNTILMDGMSSSEKADFAMNKLRSTFGNMSGGELDTFNGQFKQITKYAGENAQALGNTLLPQMTELAKKYAETLKASSEWVAGHKVLAGAVMDTGLQIGLLLTVIGGVLLSLPKLIAGFQALWTVILANPLLATAAGATALVLALENLAIRIQEEHNANINAGKSLRDKIALMEEAKKKYKELATDASLSAEEQKSALNNYMSALTAQKMYEEQLNTETSARINAQKAADADADYARMIEENRLKMAENDYYYAAIQERQNQLTEYHKAKMAQMQLNWRSAWNLMFIDALNFQTNFYNHFTSMMSSIQTGLAANFAEMVMGMKLSWQGLSDAMTKIGNMIQTAIVQMLATIAAEWVVKHGIMMAATLIWKALTVAANAAVAAATAAAATAWTLWGAIAIGASIGAAVLAFGNQFAGGVENFSGGMAIVGERGPELVRLPSGSSVYSNAKSASMLNGQSVQIIVNVYDNEVLGDSAISELAEKVGDSIMKQVVLEKNI